MSATYIHWVEAGDPAAARAHGLTVLARCGAIYTPSSTAVGPCPTCEELGGPIPNGLVRRAVAENSPHYVYRCFDDEDLLLYVGCTYDLNTRRLSHSKNSWWFSQMASWRVVIYPTKLHALRVERRAIESERPLWNVRHQMFSEWNPEHLRLGRGMALAAEAPASVLKRFDRLAGAL